MSQVALSQLGWRNKVVITPDDPGFPGKNMYDAAADLNRRYKKILLLMNSGSGYSNDPIMANFKEYGFCSAIVKPYQLDELSEVINQFID